MTIFAKRTILDVWKGSVYAFYFMSIVPCFSVLSPPEVFLGKGVLKICSKLTGGHPCWSAISIKLKSSFLKKEASYLFWNLCYLRLDQKLESQVCKKLLIWQWIINDLCISFKWYFSELFLFSSKFKLSCSYYELLHKMCYISKEVVTLSRFFKMFIWQ